MIHGDVTRSASASCTATATAYRLPSHAQIGTPRGAAARVPGTDTDPSRRHERGAHELASRAARVARPTSAAAAATSRSTASRTMPLPAASSRAAAYPRPRGRRRARARRGLRGGAHRPDHLGIGQAAQRGGERLHLLLAPDGDLDRDRVRKLREPADVADDERLADRERTDRGSRRLAHRRRAQQHDRVARLHERPQPLLLDVRLADDTGVVEPRARDAAREVEARRLGADEQEARAVSRAAQTGERGQQLRDALVLVDVPEAADQRRALDALRRDVAARARPGARRGAAARRSRARARALST